MKHFAFLQILFLSVIIVWAAIVKWPTRILKWFCKCVPHFTFSFLVLPYGHTESSSWSCRKIEDFEIRSSHSFMKSGVLFLFVCLIFSLLLIEGIPLWTLLPVIASVLFYSLAIFRNLYWIFNFFFTFHQSILNRHFHDSSSLPNKNLVLKWLDMEVMTASCLITIP